MPNPDRDDKHVRFLELFTEDSGVQPREGTHMLRLQPKASGPLRYSRIEQLIDVSAVVPREGCTVDASFAFCSEFPKQASLYAIKIFAFDRSLETSGDVRGNLMEIAIADATRKFRVKTVIGGEREAFGWTCPPART